MTKEEIINTCNIISEYNRSKDDNLNLTFLMTKSLYPNLHKIVEQLQSYDNIYNHIANKVTMSKGCFKEFKFLWHEYIIDKVKNKDLYEMKISGRDFYIFIEYILWGLTTCDDEYEFEIEKTYMEDYEIENKNDLPYGIVTALKFLKEELGGNDIGD